MTTGPGWHSGPPLRPGAKEIFGRRRAIFARERLVPIFWLLFGAAPGDPGGKLVAGTLDLSTQPGAGGLRPLPGAFGVDPEAGGGLVELEIVEHALE
jgi:hypothetical protein